MDTHTTTTGHTLTIDTDALTLEIGGDVDTMQSIPDDEIEAACAAAGVRCVWDAVLSPTCYRVAASDVGMLPIVSE